MSKNFPYNVMRHRDWDRAPRVEAIATSIIAATGATSTLAIAAIYAGTYLAVTAVTSWAISALSPKPDFSSFGSQGTLVNARDATAPVDFVYGQVRKGGTVSYYESTGEKNKFLHQIIVLAGHEVEQIGDIYVNDEIVTLDGDGFVTGDTWNSKIRIQKFDGSQTSAPADLLAESELTGPNALTADFVGNGIAYLYVRYEYDGEVFASGVPLITAVVQGKKVYDPRTSTTAYSNNAALCIRDFITSTYGLSDNSIDDVSFSAAANESDENVSLSGGGTEKRYTINGIVKASSPTGKVLGDMATACAGTLFWGSGYWKLKVGAYTAPVKTLTLDDLRGPINLQTRSSTRDSFNGVGGTFNNADGDFITADYPPIKSNVFKDEDGGDEMLLDLPLPFTTSASTAQRIAKMTLYRGREQMTISADFGLEAFNIEVGDIIAFDNDRYGFDGKEFEVIGWKFASDQEAGDLRVTLTLQETSEAAFDWNAEEQDIINNNTNLPSPSEGLSVANLQVSDDGLTQGDGTFINRVIVTWSAATNAYLDYYEVEWKATSDSAYNSTTTDTNSIELSPLVDGVEYTFRVRAVASNGFKGTKVSLTFTAGGDTTAPGIPSSVSGYPGTLSNLITWTNPADSDFKHTEVYSNTSNSSSGATLTGTSGGTEFTHIGLSGGTTVYYWLKSVDYSGNRSGFSSGTGAITTLAAPSDGLDGLNNTTVFLYNKSSSATAPALFSGTFTYTFSTGVLSGGTLNGWSQEPPTLSQGDNLFVSLATASSRTETDSIPSTEFSTPEITSIAGTDGLPGANGYNTATVSLLRKTSTASAPSDPTGTFTYTFSTGLLSGGTLNGWSQTAPSLSKGEYLWVIQASAYSNTSTDTIAASEFTAASIVGIAGDDGVAGDAGATGDTVITGKVYYQILQSNQPNTPSASSYNVSTASFSGLTSNWSLTQPSVEITDTSLKEWSSDFTVTIDGVTSVQTIVFTAPSGAIQVTADLESDNYAPGSSGWRIERDTGNAEFQSATIRGTLNAADITAGTLNVARLPGIGVAGATTVDSFFNTSGTVNVTVSFSGVTTGSSMIAVITGRFGMSKSSPIVGIVPVGTNVTLAHTQSTGGFVSENSSPITPHTHAVSATATSTSGSLGFTLSGTPSGNMYYRVAVSLLTFKA